MLKHCFKEIKKDKKSLVFNVVTNLKKEIMNLRK